MQPAPSITIDDIFAARDRILGNVLLTPCPVSEALSHLTGSRVVCKLEYLQRTGSFKERGACNALMLLKGKKLKGAVTASAGNHALALAYHGKRLGVPVTVVMPKFAPLIKSHNSRLLGANVILHGDSFMEAKQEANELAKKEGLYYVHGFDDPHVIAGAGTLGLELIEEVPDLDAVIVPVGGGGLLAGVSLAIKSVRPHIQVIGVEGSTMPGFAAALRAGEPTTVPAVPTLADGLAVGCVGTNAFQIAREHLDRLIEVDEATIAQAILRLIEMEKAVIEGAAASSLAALISGQLPELSGKRVCLLLCGGNIDPLLLSTVIEKAMAADGRLVRFVASISDRPGGLAKLATLIAEAGATIIEVTHDRAFCGANAFNVNVICRVATRDAEHAAQLIQSLSIFDARLM